MAIFDGGGAREMIFCWMMRFLIVFPLSKVHFISELYQKEIVKALRYSSVKQNTKKKKYYVENCQS